MNQSQERSIQALAKLNPENIVANFRDKCAQNFEKHGLTMTHVMARHGELLQSTDETVSLNSVKLAYQLHGMNDEQSSQQTGDIIMQVNIVNVPTNHSDTTTKQ